MKRSVATFVLPLLLSCALAGCTDSQTASGPTRGQILAAFLDAGYSDSVTECVVGLVERQFGLDVLGTVSVEEVAAAAESQTASGDAATVAVGEVLASCLAAEAMANPDLQATALVELAFANEPFTYGEDPALDALWDACEGGSGAACDQLWAEAPLDSVYEKFGVTCGNRLDVLNCTQEMDFPDLEDTDSDDQ